MYNSKREQKKSLSSEIRVAVELNWWWGSKSTRAISMAGLPYSKATD